MNHHKYFQIQLAILFFFGPKDFIHYRLNEKYHSMLCSNRHTTDSSGKIPLYLPLALSVSKSSNIERRKIEQEKE